MLRILGRTLGETMRHMGMAARFGGDEFVLILLTDSLDDAKHGTARIRQVIEKSVVQVDNHVLRVTASIGLAQRLPGEDGPSLLRRADQSLYTSKKAGRNSVHWHDGKQSHPVADGETSLAGQPADQLLHDALPLVAQPEADGGAIGLASSTV